MVRIAGIDMTEFVKGAVLVGDNMDIKSFLVKIGKEYNFITEKVRSRQWYDGKVLRKSPDSNRYNWINLKEWLECEGLIKNYHAA